MISTNVTEQGQNYLEVKDSLAVASYVVRKNDTVHFAPEKRAEFKGGSNKMHEYIQKIMKYPKQARKSKTQGQVYVVFIVNKKGNVEEIRISTGIGAGCDEEAVRCCSAPMGSGHLEKCSCQVDGFYASRLLVKTTLVLAPWCSDCH